MSLFDRIMSFFARLCRDHPRAVVLVCVLLTIPVAVGASFIEVKAGQRDLIPTKYETSRTITEVNELFGGTTNEYPMVESGALLAYPMIRKFLLLEGAMVEEVGEGDYIYMEHYLTAFGRNLLREFRARAQSDYGLSKEAAERQLPDISAAIDFGEMVGGEAFKRQIEDGLTEYLANPVAYKWTVEKEGSGLLSEDGRYAKILIKVNPELDSAQRKDYADRIESFFHSYFEGGEVPATVYISGDPSIDKDLEDYVVSSTWMLAVAAAALLMLLLFLTFQRLTDVVLPMMVIALTAMWIYGFMGWFHIPFTMLSAIIGPLVLGISLGNLVYMMSRFYEEFGIDREPSKSAYKSVVTVGVAVFLACITTVFGFASFAFSDFDVLQDFGFMTGAGIALCFLFSVTFLPALMILREERRMRRGTSRQPRGVKIFARDSNTRIDRFLGRIAAISQGSPKAVVVIYCFIVVICVFGAFRLTTTPDLRALAPQNIPSLQAQYLQESIFGGVQQDVVLLTGDVLEPEALEAMRGFQEEIAASPYFSREGSSSIGELISDYRVEMGKAGADGAAALPATTAEAEADLAEIGELFGPQEGKLVSGDHKAALVAVFSEGAQSNREMMEKNSILKEAAASSFGTAGITYQVGGVTPLTAEMLGNLVPTQIETSILALILSGLVLVLVFRSITYGLATLSVLVAGITMELGFLALMGWTLDMMTVLVVSMIIGMGIDYGIHVTHRFLEEHTGEVSVAEALAICITRVGKPLMASTICTAGAFLVISFSRMQPIRRFGLITALSLTVAFFASLLVLPSIITLIERRRRLVEEKTAVEPGDLKPAGANHRA